MDELEWLRERVAGMTEGRWWVEAGELTYKNQYGAAHVIPPDPIAWDDAPTVATLRNVAVELMEVARAAEHTVARGLDSFAPSVGRKNREALDNLIAAIRREMEREK